MTYYQGPSEPVRATRIINILQTSAGGYQLDLINRQVRVSNHFIQRYNTQPGDYYVSLMAGQSLSVPEITFLTLFKVV